MLKESYPQIFFMGLSTAGKTTMIKRYLSGVFLEKTLSTMTFDWGIKVVSEKFKFRIWDSVGKENLLLLGKMYFEKCQGIVLVYDLSSRINFQKLKELFFKIIKITPDKRFLLLGNKLDLNLIREVSFEEGLQFSFENNLMFSEVSSKDGQNLEDALDIFLMTCYYKNHKLFNFLSLFFSKLKRDDRKELLQIFYLKNYRQIMKKIYHFFSLQPTTIQIKRKFDQILVN